MTFVFLVAAFIFFCVRYLWRKNAPRTLDILDDAVNKWRTSRMDIIHELREAANLLRASHRRRAETEQASAKKSLVGDLLGIGGIVLAPFSGGLSLVATGASVFASVNSMLSDRKANKEHEENASKIKGMMEKAEELDKSASEELNILLSNFDYIEEQLCSMKLGDGLSVFKEFSAPAMGIEVLKTKTDIDNDREDDPSYQDDELSQADYDMKVKQTMIDEEKGQLDGSHCGKDPLMTGQGLKMPSSVDLSAVLNCAEQVFNGTKLSKEISSTAKPTKELASWTKSISKISKETKTFSNVKNARKTIKTVKAVKKASTAVKTITKATSQSHKVAKTTQITTKTVKLGKTAKLGTASSTAAKAAKISKFGLAVSTVALPFDIYNLIQTSKNIDKVQDDVVEIEGKANQLEEELDNIKNALLSRRTYIERLHKQLCKLYEEHHSDEILEHLIMMYEKLGLDLPAPY